MSFLMLADSALFLYVVLPILFLSLCWVIEGTENVGGATIGLGIVLVAMQVFTDIHPFSYIINDPFRALVVAALYVLVGVGYVWIKWFSYVNTAARKIAEYMASGSTNDIDYACRRAGYKSVPLKVSDYKGKIIGWMAYWPISAAWTVLNDPVRRLFEAVYNGIAKSLQSISDKAFSGISKS